MTQFEILIFKYFDTNFTFKYYTSCGMKIAVGHIVISVEF